MSKYATLDDLLSRLSSLYGGLYADREGETMTREAQSDLDSAEAEINGLIGTRFRVPVTAEGSLPLLRICAVRRRTECRKTDRETGRNEGRKLVADRKPSGQTRTRKKNARDV